MIIELITDSKGKQVLKELGHDPIELVDGFPQWLYELDGRVFTKWTKQIDMITENRTRECETNLIKKVQYDRKRSYTNIPEAVQLPEDLYPISLENTENTSVKVEEGKTKKLQEIKDRFLRTHDITLIKTHKDLCKCVMYIGRDDGRNEIIDDNIIWTWFVDQYPELITQKWKFEDLILTELFINKSVSDKEFNKIELKHSNNIMTNGGLLKVGDEISKITKIDHKEYYKFEIEATYNPELLENENITASFLLNKVFKGDELSFNWYLVMIADIIIPQNKLQNFYILHGDGGNGKTYFMNNLIFKLVGDDNKTIINFINLTNPNKSFEMQKLENKLLAYDDDSSKTINGLFEQLKKISGSEQINIEKKGVNAYDGVNYATLVCSANSLPTFNEHNNALTRRLKIIDFPQKFDSNKNKEEFKAVEKDIAKQETLDYIFTLALSKYFEHLETPLPVTKITTDHLEFNAAQNNHVGGWFESYTYYTVNAKREYYSAESVMRKRPGVLFKEYVNDNPRSKIGRHSFYREVEKVFGFNPLKASRVNNRRDEAGQFTSWEAKITQNDMPFDVEEGDEVN